MKICCFWTFLQTCYTILEGKTGGGDHHTKFPMFCWPSIVIFCLLLVHSQWSTVYHLCSCKSSGFFLQQPLMSLEDKNFVYSCSWYLVCHYLYTYFVLFQGLCYLSNVNLLYIFLFRKVTFCGFRWIRILPFAHLVVYVVKQITTFCL